MEEKKYTRRDFLKAAGSVGLGAAAGGILSACAPREAAVTEPTAVPTRGPTVVAGREDMLLGVATDARSLGFTVKPGADGHIARAHINPKMIYTDYETNELKPELLEEWSAENPTTWVGKVREGVMWQRGYGEVTAEDIAYTINYIKENKAYKHDSAHLFTEGARVRSKYVVEFNLSQPFGAFPGVGLDDGGIVACKAAHEEMGDEEYSRNPVGFGPYMLEEWVSGSHIILRKNPDYWREGQPILEELVFRIIPDPAVALASLERGEIDFTANLLAKDFAAVDRSDELALVSVPGWNWFGMGIGMAGRFDPEYVAEDYPTQDVRVRQAMSFAINRRAIVDTVYQGHAAPTDNPLLEGFLGYDSPFVMYTEEGDVTRAQALMDEAGVDGFDLSVITDGDASDQVQVMEIIAEQLGAIGINVQIETLDRATWTERWRSQQFTAGFREISFVAGDSDAPCFAFNRSGAAHWMGLLDEDVDAWLDQTRASTDQAERDQLFGQVVGWAVENAPYIYTFHKNVTQAQHRNLAGIPPRRVDFNLFLREAHWAA